MDYTTQAEDLTQQPARYLVVMDGDDWKTLCITDKSIEKLKKQLDKRGLAYFEPEETWAKEDPEIEFEWPCDDTSVTERVVEHKGLVGLEWHISRGVPLLPLHNPMPNGTCSCGKSDCVENKIGKHPINMNGYKGATSDKEQIERWNRQFQNSNWGMATGEVSGICVLDVDPRHDGFKSLEKLFPGQKPETRIIKTGSNGYHYYLNYDPLYSKTRKGEKQGLLPGLDFLADGSYVVAPGSLHWTGNTYETISELPLAEIPEDLKALLRKAYSAEKESGTGKIHSSFSEIVEEGERDNTYASMAGTLLRQKGMTPELALAALEVHNAKYCKPPLEDSDLERIVNSINKKETERRENEKELTPKEYEKYWKLYSLKEVRNLPPVAWYIEGVFQKGGLSAFVGASGSYKSFLAFEIMAHIAMGWNWHGLEVKKAKVLYVAAEGQDGMSIRIDAFLKHHNIDDIPEFFLFLHPFKLTNEGEVDALLGAIREKWNDFLQESEDGILVIDTLSDCFEGNESATPDMQKFVDAARHFEFKTGATISIIHHTGKDGSPDGRGSVVLKGAANGLFFVKKDLNNTMTFSCTKQRNGPDFTDMSFQFQEIEGTKSGVLIPLVGNQNKETKRLSADQKNAKAICDLLNRSQPNGLKKTEICSRLCFSSSAFD